MWANVLDQALDTAKEAWELDETNEITRSENTIRIKYNFKNLKLYIEHSIIYL